jgi:hypothetical protein
VKDDIYAENKRLKAEVEKLLNENMELMGVIRAMRKTAKEDAVELLDAQNELWLWKNGKYEKQTGNE